MANTNIKAGMFHGVIGNGPNGYFLKTNGDGSMTWDEAGTPSPTVTSVTYPGDDTAADPAGSQSVTLTGTNFATGATVTIGGTTAPTVSFVSATELTITTPAKAAGDYDIVVTNTDGGTATFVDGISYNGIPAWTTASGSLGTFASDTTISTITLQASEPDAGTITFNITSGALPTGLSLTGANIDGTTSIETADTLYNFTVTAIDDENQSTPRAFSITVEKWVITAPENFEIVTYTGNGGTQAITSKIGKAASFNGSSSTILTTSSFANLQTFSVSSFVNFSTVSGTVVIAGTDYKTGGATGDTGWMFRLRNGNKLNLVRVADGVFTNVEVDWTPTANTWYHISATRTSTETKFYVDGTQQGTTQTGGTGTISYSSDAAFTIGVYRYASTNYNVFNGKIDQVRIFDKAISSSEVTTLYNETYDSSTKSTTDIFNDDSGVALYELDEDANDTGSYPYGTGVPIDGGQSAVFDGSSSYISGLNNVIPATNTDCSFSCWFNMASSFSSDFKSILGGQGTDSLRITIKYVSSGNYNIEVLRGMGGSSYYSTSWLSTPISPNTWHNLVVTYSYSNNTANVFLNNNLINSEVLSLSASTTINTNLILGVYRTNVGFSYFNGSIDQVRIYSSALSASDVEALVSETNVPTANLVAHYKLDGNANDETGSYNGTPTSITYSDPAEFPLVQYNGTPTNVNFLGMAFQPDFVWVKQRDNTRSHRLTDSVRGANKIILSNDTSQELIRTDEIGSFDSNGFTIGANVGVNDNTGDYVAWCWKAGGAAVLNENGSIDSQVSANTDAGFSIVKWTADGNGFSSDIGHGLTSAPELIISKDTDTANDWIVTSSLFSNTVRNFLKLNLSDAIGTSGLDSYALTATTFKLAPRNNTIGKEIISYCFHSVDGYQKVGSYQGTAVAGLEVTGLGFSPRFVMLKNTTSTGSWIIHSKPPTTTNPSVFHLRANTSGAEDNGANEQIDFDDDGFTLNGTGGNANSNNTYIYLAIA